LDNHDYAYDEKHKIGVFSDELNYNPKNVGKIKNTLALIRVKYGKKETPRELQEFKLNDGREMSPVGCIDEWLVFAKRQGYNNLTLLNLDGSFEEIEVK
jgi:hypothetical protein